jgi:hypothetical protein
MRGFTVPHACPAEIDDDNPVKRVEQFDGTG